MLLAFSLIIFLGKTSQNIYRQFQGFFSQNVQFH
jgi:hypothetical protein